MCEHGQIHVRITKFGQMHKYAKCAYCKETIEATPPKSLSVIEADEVGKEQIKASQMIYGLFIPNG